MKDYIKITRVFLAFILIFALASCTAIRKTDLIGIYDMKSITGGGMNLTEEQVDAMKDKGMDATLEIREDNTAVMDIYGDKTQYTYNLSKMIFSANGKNTKFRFDGKKLTLLSGDTTILFEKRS